MQAKSQQSNAFPARFFGLGLKGFLMLAAILLLLEIAIIFAVFGTDLFFSLIIDEFSSVTPAALQTSHSLQTCATTARTFALLQT